MTKVVRNNILYQYGLQLAKYVLPFVTLPYLTRVLGPDVYAVRAYTLSLMSLMMVVLDYGLMLYGTKRLAESMNNVDESNRAHTSIMVIRLVLSALGAIIVGIFCFSLELLNGFAIFVFLSYAAVLCKALLPDYVFQANQRMGILTNRFVVTQVLATIAIFSLVKDGEDLVLLSVIEATAALFALIWSLYKAAKMYRLSLALITVKQLIAVFRSGTVFFISVVSTTLLSTFTGLMLGPFSESQTDIIYWSFAVAVITAVTGLYSPVLNSIYPHVVVTKDLLLVKKFLLIGSPVAFLLAIGIALMHSPIMFVLAGNQYSDGSIIFVLIAPLLFLSYPVMLLGFPVLGALDKVHWLTYSSAFATFSNVIVILVLSWTGNLSLITAACARVLAELILLVHRIILVRKTIRSRQKRWAE